ncbi:SRPBCC family protein [Chloroflexota bacterium]
MASPFFVAQIALLLAYSNMVTCNEDILVEKIFNYLSPPNNFPEFWPSVVKVTDIQLLPNGGYKARYVYKMAGMSFKGIAECTEIVPNKSFVIVSKGGIGSVQTWTFRSKANQTKVTLTIDYKIPIPLLGKVTEAIVKEINKQELTLILSNLRSRFAFSII